MLSISAAISVSAVGWYRLANNMEHGYIAFDEQRRAVCDLLGADVGDAFLQVLLGGIIDHDVESAQRLHCLHNYALAERLVANRSMFCATFMSVGRKKQPCTWQDFQLVSGIACADERVRA